MRQEEKKDQLINPRNTKLHVHAPPPPLPTHLPYIHLISLQRQLGIESSIVLREI